MPNIHLEFNTIDSDKALSLAELITFLCDHSDVTVWSKSWIIDGYKDGLMAVSKDQALAFYYIDDTVKKAHVCSYKTCKSPFLAYESMSEDEALCPECYKEDN